MAVAGLPSPTEEFKRKRTRLGSSANYIPLHRASYHGSRDKSINRPIDPPVKSKSGDVHSTDVIGSAESLVGRVLFEQGLGKYCDPGFVRATQRELAEAMDLTQEEMDRAAHQLLQLERRRSMPYVHLCLEPEQGPRDEADHSPRALAKGLAPERAASALGMAKSPSSEGPSSPEEQRGAQTTNTRGQRKDNQPMIHQTKL